MSDILIMALQHREELLRDIDRLEDLLARAECLAEQKQSIVSTAACAEEDTLVLEPRPQSKVIYLEGPAEEAALEAARRLYKGGQDDAQHDDRTILQRMMGRKSLSHGGKPRSVFRGALLHRLDDEMVAA
ncbi:MAG: hypothetical protein OEN23_08605 [Paracoccaceae bacterium]|nr:hypothetical protein [Paracoccaceae bacterium]